MRLLLDEHLDAAIAVELRRRGHDVLALTEDPALVGLPDHELLDHAAQARRALVTYDARGFGPLVEQRGAGGGSFAGVIFLSAKRYPQRHRATGAIVRDLERLLRERPERDWLVGRAVWLGPAPR